MSAILYYLGLALRTALLGVLVVAVGIGLADLLGRAMAGRLVDKDGGEV
jgi:hypothetical protein